MRIRELCLQVREDGRLLHSLNRNNHSSGRDGLSLQFCYWQAEPLGMDAEHIARTALIHLGDFSVRMCLFLLCFCFLGSLCVCLAEQPFHPS